MSHWSDSTQNRSFGRHSSQPISWLSTEETKPNTTKANVDPEHKNTTIQNKHKTKPTFGHLV